MERLNKLYYSIKPFIPRRVQIIIRRKMVLRKALLCEDIWPIYGKASNQRDMFPGWPEQKRFALVLIHDVDTAKGHDKSYELMNLEKGLGFRSSFNFVPERYNVSSELRVHLTRNGFEVGVHGLKHDGKLYQSHKRFQQRAIQINQYLRDWGSVGFSSPATHHKLDWLHELNIEYDASTFDTDPFEPQSDAAATIFPFWVKNNIIQRGYIELPYTLPQDFTLFVLRKENNIDIWKRKLDWIVENGGMALLDVHPDYMAFDGNDPGLEEYPAQYYEEFLHYIKNKYQGQYWHALPKDIARFWAMNTSVQDS